MTWPHWVLFVILAFCAAVGASQDGEESKVGAVACFVFLFLLIYGQ